VKVERKFIKKTKEVEHLESFQNGTHIPFMCWLKTTRYALSIAIANYTILVLGYNP
jgi:hypothetical protein